MLETKRIKEVVYEATISPIGDEIKTRMKYSWQEDNPVKLDDLHYIQLNHWGFDQCVHTGELIVHKEVAKEVVDIFEELFLQEYSLEKMILIDAYYANDKLSCEDNNS